MQDQLKMRADNRRRTLIKRADFPQLKYLGDLIVDELPDDRTHPLCHCCGRSTSSGKDETSSCTAILERAKRTVPTALGIEACTQGMTVMFTSVPRLITRIKEARQERALRSLENRFINY